MPTGSGQSDTGRMTDMIDAKDIEQLQKSIKTIKQTFSEVHHAQSCGAQWYTRGEDGLYRQVSMWVRRGVDAVKEIEQIIEKGEPIKDAKNREEDRARLDSDS